MRSVSTDLPDNLDRALRRLGEGDLGAVRDEGLQAEVRRLRGAVRALGAAVMAGSATLSGIWLWVGTSGSARLVGLALGAMGAVGMIDSWWRMGREPQP